MATASESRRSFVPMLELMTEAGLADAAKTLDGAVLGGFARIVYYRAQRSLT